MFTLDTVAAWSQDNGFKALQIPAWDSRLFDVNTAAKSQNYCDDLRGRLAERGLAISKLTSHISAS